MNKYIGFKMIEAEPMNLGDYNKFKGWPIPKDENPLTEGYKVKYSDEYISWSPKEVFEISHMQVNSDNKITQKDVDGFIAVCYDFKLGDKTTVVKATLVNGFEIVESSSCVDINNFSQEVGTEICVGKIKNKVWELLGFLLQTASSGIK